MCVCVCVCLCVLSKFGCEVPYSPHLRGLALVVAVMGPALQKRSLNKQGCQRIHLHPSMPSAHLFIKRNTLLHPQVSVKTSAAIITTTAAVAIAIVSATIVTADTVVVQCQPFGGVACWVGWVPTP